MRFLKEHSYDVVRLYINQIGITIFSLLLYFSSSSLDGSIALKLKVGISVFATLFYFVLLYTAAWDWGANDIIRIEGGRQKKNIFKGALLSVLSQVINFILAGVCILTISLVMNGSEGANSVFFVFNLILRFTNAMYLGMLQGIFASFEADANLYYLLHSIGYMVLPLLAILATHIGYVFGLKNIKIFSSGKKKNNK